MKFKWDKKYLYWGTTALVVLLVAVLFNFILQNNVSIRAAFNTLFKICTPIIDGIIIAFLVNSLVKWFENKVFPVFNKKLYLVKDLSDRSKVIIRTLAIILSYLVIIAVIAGFIVAIIPQITESISDIKVQFPNYEKNFLAWIDKLSNKYPEIAKMVENVIINYEDDFINWRDTVLIPWLQRFGASMSMYIIKSFSAVWDLIIGFVVSIYILSKKETFKGQYKKIIYSIFNIKNGNVIIKNTRMVNDKFSGFIVGKILDSIIIGLITFIVCRIFSLEYDVLLAIIIGVTNIIPFFGPFIGAIPTTLLLLLINPIHALYFVIFVIIIQLLDGNVIGPKILGDSTGISSFWVIFAITIFGGFWGVPGMIIGVPLFAVIYTLIQSLLDISLKNKDLKRTTKDYVYLDYIDVDTKEYIDKTFEIPEKKPKKKKKDKASKDMNDSSEKVTTSEQEGNIKKESDINE